MLRFSNLLLLFFVLVVVIGSPLSIFGCRTYRPGVGLDSEAPCADAVFIDITGHSVTNFLEHTPIIIAVVTLTVLAGILKRQLLPMPVGCECEPLLPPPRFA